MVSKKKKINNNSSLKRIVPYQDKGEHRFICYVEVKRQYIVLAKGNVRIIVEKQIRFLIVPL